MHCKSGADRAGVMAVLYMHSALACRSRRPFEQLSMWKYLRVTQGRTGMLDFSSRPTSKETAETGKPFIDWVNEDYDPARSESVFPISSWWANILVDRILRRE